MKEDVARTLRQNLNSFKYPGRQYRVLQPMEIFLGYFLLHFPGGNKHENGENSK